jgi:pimeloyl-ACP methyl ester carboxylesterase
MREFPVFIPHGAERLAAVVTVPDTEPLGVVMLFTGTGAPRSHRYQVWARLARQLADSGLASVRMDREGIGDSSGELRAHRMNDALVNQAMTVAQFATHATGTDRIGVAGNCSGSRMALYVAAMSPTCVGTVCVLPRVIEPGGVHSIAVSARRLKIASFLRRIKPLRRMTDPIRHRRRKVSSVVERYLSQALDHGRVLFLYSEQDPDAYNEGSVAALKGMLNRFTQSRRERFKVRVLSNGPLVGFESRTAQQDSIDTIRDWLVECFARAQPSEAAVH